MSGVDDQFRKALQHHEAGRLAEAEAIYRAIIGKAGDHADSFHLLGVIALQKGDPEGAIGLIGKAVGLDKTAPSYFVNLGNAYYAQESFPEAIEAYRHALSLNPLDVPTRLSLGNALHDSGHHEEALSALGAVIASTPKLAQAHFKRGAILKVLNRYEEAVGAFARVVELELNNADAHNNLGTALLALKKPREALASLRWALALKPDSAEFANNTGLALKEMGAVDGAARHFEAAINLKPELSEARLNLAQLLLEGGRDKEAESLYRNGLAVRENDPALHCAFGKLLQRRRDYEGALAHYRRAMDLQAFFPEAEGLCFHVRQIICDWSDLARQTSVFKEIAAGQRAAEYEPFVAQSTPGLSMNDLRAIGERYAERKFGPFISQGRAGPFHFTPGARQRLRVGYLSPDFCNHVVGEQIAPVLERHDRVQFEIFCYSCGPDDGGPVRARIKKAVSAFHDIGNASAWDAARQIHSDGIDVLVDLAGYTDGSRPEVLALRPAPVQAGFLGYPTSTGAPYLDYHITDQEVCPPGLADSYSETLAYVRWSHLNGEPAADIPPPPPRAACGLPDNAVVFCCFNASYKISPGIFHVWMDILRAVPDSVLWLRHVNEACSVNLRREAEVLGVDSARLAFAPLVPMPLHLARHACADLFLDTLPATAATTGIDALKAGLPILTCRGKTAVGRIGAGLLTAAGLPELIAGDLKDYACRAKELALNPVARTALRAKLLARLQEAPLFNPERLARDLEKLYGRMWRRYLSRDQTGILNAEVDGAVSP